MAELVPTTTKKIIKNQPFMLEERFTYQNVEELLYKYTNNCYYSTHITMVTKTSNSGVKVSKKKMLRENGERITGSEYFWLSSGRSEMEGREKVYITTETTIYPKSLVIYLKSSYYLDEVWLTTYHTSP